MTLDSWGSPLSALKASGFSFCETTPWITPVPSRKIGNKSLPDSRKLYSQPRIFTARPMCSCARSMEIAGMGAWASWLMFSRERSIAGCADAFFVEMFFQFVEDRANFVERGRAGSRFFQFQYQRQRFVRGGNCDESRVPIKGALIGQQMLVLFTVIIVDVGVGDMVTHKVKAFDGAAFDVRVADIEAEDGIVEVRFLYELRQGRWGTELVGRILQSDGDAALLREDCQMLERVECGVEFAWIGGLAAGGEMESEITEWNFLGNIERTLHFVHGFDAPDALRVGDGNGDSASSSSRGIAVGGRVQ